MMYDHLSNNLKTSYFSPPPFHSVTSSALVFMQTCNSFKKPKEAVLLTQMGLYIGDGITACKLFWSGLCSGKGCTHLSSSINNDFINNNSLR